jgi:hypothetical protein
VEYVELLYCRKLLTSYVVAGFLVCLVFQSFVSQNLAYVITTFCALSCGLGESCGSVGARAGSGAWQPWVSGNWSLDLSG